MRAPECACGTCGVLWWDVLHVAEMRNLSWVPALFRGEAGDSGEAGSSAPPSSPWEGPLVLASVVTVCEVSPWTMDEREKQDFVC